MHPLISICIPAYKNESLLVRLLDSIQIQIFTDFEVIITDDSPNDSMLALCEKYYTSFALTYIWNYKPLGTPANWNFAISKAKGEWIKIMHADDWFVAKESLNLFAEAAQENVDFVFSAFNNVNLENNFCKLSKMSLLELALLKKSPYNLFKKNFIGHPSTTLIRRKPDQIIYDERIKWVVDFDYYIRFLSVNNNFSYINTPLINIGIHDNQVTKMSFRVKEVEIPENIYLLNKLGMQHLKNIFVYDYYWRLLRNLEIRRSNDLLSYINLELVPSAILKIIDAQSKIPKTVLKNGIFSKVLMGISYINNKSLDRT